MGHRSRRCLRGTTIGRRPGRLMTSPSALNCWTARPAVLSLTPYFAASSAVLVGVGGFGLVGKDFLTKELGDLAVGRLSRKRHPGLPSLTSVFGPARPLAS